MSETASFEKSLRNNEYCGQNWPGKAGKAPRSPATPTIHRLPASRQGKRKQSALPKPLGHMEEMIPPPRFNGCYSRIDLAPLCEHTIPRIFTGVHRAYGELTILFEGEGGLTCSSSRHVERDSTGGIGGHAPPARRRPWPIGLATNG